LIEFSANQEDLEVKLEIPNSLLLSPDMSTLREMPWQKKEAIVFADVYHPDDIN
jgi:glutamine synthetase